MRMDIQKCLERYSLEREQMNWSNISHFTRSEFSCRCGCELPLIAEEHYWYLCFYILDPLREDAGSSIVIHRGYSCPEHNANIGGRPKSYHTIPTGATFRHPCAVDMYAPQLSYTEFDWLVRKHTDLNYCGYHIYINDEGLYFMHIDWRGRRARWR